MKEEKIRHLEIIQNVITRMNTNSFQIKGLTIAIVSALVVLYASSTNLNLLLVAFMPTIILWFLDTYYLQQERKFRGVYNDVAGITKKNDVKLFAMSIKEYKKDKYSYWNVFISPTIIWFHLPIIILLFTTYIIIRNANLC